LPWMIGAIYWRSKGADAEWLRRYGGDSDIPAAFSDGAFVVKAGTLAFSVAIFCCCATCCLVAITARRYLCEGELGGPVRSKHLTSAGLVGLWFFYIGMSIWKAYS